MLPHMRTLEIYGVIVKMDYQRYGEERNNQMAGGGESSDDMQHTVLKLFINVLLICKISRKLAIFLCTL